MRRLLPQLQHLEVAFNAGHKTLRLLLSGKNNPCKIGISQFALEFITQHGIAAEAFVPINRSLQHNHATNPPLASQADTQLRGIAPCGHTQVAVQGIRSITLPCIYAS